MRIRWSHEDGAPMIAFTILWEGEKRPDLTHLLCFLLCHALCPAVMRQERSSPAAGKMLLDFPAFIFIYALNKFLFFISYLVSGVFLSPRTRDWTQTLYTLGKHPATWAAPSALLFVFCFWDRVHLTLCGWTWDSPVSTSWVDGIAGVYHHIQAGIFFYSNRKWTKTLDLL
jgi:hypothetical protein